MTPETTNTTVVLRYSGPYRSDGTGFHVWCDNLSYDHLSEGHGPTYELSDGYGKTLELAKADYLRNLQALVDTAHRLIRIAAQVNGSVPLKENTES